MWLICVVFVVAGVAIVSSDPRSWLAWLCVVFFGFGVALFSVQIVRPARLHLDGTGLSYRPALQQEWSCRWDEVSKFGLVESGQPMIIFDRPQVAAQRSGLSAVNRGLLGVNSAILVTDLVRGESDRIDLVRLLNAYRDHVLGTA